MEVYGHPSDLVISQNGVSGEQRLVGDPVQFKRLLEAQVLCGLWPVSKSMLWVSSKVSTLSIWGV